MMDAVSSLLGRIRSFNGGPQVSEQSHVMEGQTSMAQSLPPSYLPTTSTGPMPNGFIGKDTDSNSDESRMDIDSAPSRSLSTLRRHPDEDELDDNAPLRRRRKRREDADPSLYESELAAPSSKKHRTDPKASTMSRSASSHRQSSSLKRKATAYEDQHSMSYEDDDDDDDDVVVHHAIQRRKRIKSTKGTNFSF